MADTHSIISASIASMRQDSPADGGPEPSGDTAAADTGAESVAEPDFDPASDASDDPTPAHDEQDQADSDDPPAPAAPPPPPAEVKPAEPENDDISKEPEHTVDGKGRKVVNRIPQPRVKKMVENAVSRKEAELTQKYAPIERQHAEFEQLGQVMATDPDRFMAMVAKAYPQYNKYVQGAQAPAAPAAPQPAADDPMPQPDARLADGTPAYSPEGFRKREEWNARQVERRVLDQVSEKYKWIDDARAQQQAREAATPGVRAQLAEATEQWEGFKDNFDAILGELQADSAEAERTGRAPRLTLHDAYRNVLTRKFKEEREAWRKERETLASDRNKMRAELLVELGRRPTSTAALPTAPVAPRSGGDSGEARDTGSIIRASIAGLRQ